MKIFITNDDGWGAKGILTLVEVMRQLGDVTVVAPDGPRSGQSSAFTVTQPLRLTCLQDEPGLRIYTCSGTPTDCVKLGLQVLFEDEKPDLLCSGINHGDNGTINVIYSGTMGAVFEGAIHQIPSIGWSICTHDADADFDYMKAEMPAITADLLAKKAQCICWNVNAPVGPIQGKRFVRHCMGYWEKDWLPTTDAEGNRIYTISGEYINLEPEATDTDKYAIANGCIAIAPCTVDMTDHSVLQTLQK